MNEHDDIDEEYTLNTYEHGLITERKREGRERESVVGAELF